MKELHQPACSNASEEVLIERTITFRNSTFGGLKAFIREHERQTGERLSNAAAVDLALRSFLPLQLHPGSEAARAMREAEAAMRGPARPQPPKLRSASRTAAPRPTITIDPKRERPWMTKDAAGGAS